RGSRRGRRVIRKMSRVAIPSGLPGRKIAARRPVMKRYGALLILLLPLLPSAAFSQTLPELFQKAKAQVKGEDWAGALKTLDALDAEAAKPGNEAAKVQLTAPTAFYRGVCEANMGNTDAAKQQFEAFLKVQPNANLDPSMYSKKAIASFEEARRAT